MKAGFDQMKNEKARLEKSLRQETQLNQEQSIKLQILKDALEKRAYDSMPTSKGTTLKEPLSNEYLTQQLNSSAKLRGFKAPISMA